MDVIVLATGFRTDRYVRPMQVTGLYGKTLEQAWSDVPTAYKSISVPDFPNFYFMNGPTSPVGNFSLIDTSEMQWGYIWQLIERVQQQGIAGLSAKAQALARYDAERLSAAKTSVFGSGCNSWYLDKNGVPNTWPWSQSRFRQEMQTPQWQDYTVHALENVAA
ncbi:MAG: hypothetical protein RR574_18755 [Comamonas sp.]